MFSVYMYIFVTCSGVPVLLNTGVTRSHSDICLSVAFFQTFFLLHPPSSREPALSFLQILDLPWNLIISLGFSMKSNSIVDKGSSMKSNSIAGQGSSMKSNSVAYKISSMKSNSVVEKGSSVKSNSVICDLLTVKGEDFLLIHIVCS